MQRHIDPVALIRNSIALLAYWGASLALVGLGERVLGGWPASELGELTGATFGVIAALRLRARAAVYIVAGLLAYSFTELTIHVMFGLRHAQGLAFRLTLLCIAWFISAVIASLRVNKL